jgi:hypothetical protein
VLANYAKTFGVGPGWLFLTGNPEDLETLRQNLGIPVHGIEIGPDISYSEAAQEE